MYGGGQPPTTASAFAHCSSLTSSNFSRNSNSNPEPTASVATGTSRVGKFGQRMRIAMTSNEGNVMAMRILWPNLPTRLVPVATEAVGSGFELEFREKFEDVSDEQWANADAVVGGCPPPYIDKLRACRIFVKYGVGYDDVDIERFGKLGIPVCNVPDYGTREVADHAIALMMTLAKSVAYHDSELRADLKGNWRPAHNPFGRRLSMCTYGVVGMGRIGTAAAL